MFEETPALILLLGSELCTGTCSVSNDEMTTCDANFLKVDQAALYGLLMAAIYLDIKNLFELMCKFLANIMKDMEMEEIQKAFNIKKDFTWKRRQKYVERINGLCNCKPPFQLLK